jgi:hypothetical protein
MAVPDSSPRASAVVSVRNPQRLMLADGTFFPPGCCAVPWGRSSAPTSVAPEALHERGCSCKVLSQCLVSVRGVSFSRHRQCFSRPRWCHTHVLTFACVRCKPRMCSRASSPEPGPTRGDRGELSNSFVRPFVVLSQDGGVRCPRLPSSGSRIANPSLSY